MLDCIHLSATGMTEIAESTNWKRCPHNFVYIVYKEREDLILDQHSGWWLAYLLDDLSERKDVGGTKRVCQCSEENRILCLHW